VLVETADTWACPDERDAVVLMLHSDALLRGFPHYCCKDLSFIVEKMRLWLTSDFGDQTC